MLAIVSTMVFLAIGYVVVHVLCELVRENGDRIVAALRGSAPTVSTTPVAASARRAYRVNVPVRPVAGPLRAAA